MWFMCEYLYYMFISIYMYVCRYMCLYICTCMSCIYSMSWIKKWINIYLFVFHLSSFLPSLVLFIPAKWSGVANPIKWEVGELGQLGDLEGVDGDMLDSLFTRLALVVLPGESQSLSALHLWIGVFVRVHAHKMGACACAWVKAWQHVDRAYYRCKEQPTILPRLVSSATRRDCVLLTRIQEAAASQHPIPNWARSVNTGLNNMSTGSSTDAATMSASGRRKLAIKKAREVWKRGFKRFRGKFPSFKPVSFTWTGNQF